MKKYIQNLLILISVVSIIAWLFFSKIIPQYYLPVFPFIILFFALVSALIHAYQARLATKNTGKFTRSIMVITLLKLFIYSAVAILYIAVDKVNAKIFIVEFMSLYLVFTFFEVFSLLNITSNSKKHG
jgi:hypothetical protein